MNRTRFFSLIVACTLPVASRAADQLIPAGSTVSCRVAEGKISSKTTAIGDPVLCTLDPVEDYGRSVFPYGSYLAGRFEDYKDPGHLVGKGWMELKFDRMYIGNRVLPVAAKVVAVPKYKVDREGKILGKGHAVRDTVEWLLPILWPIDLVNLPRRGPVPVLLPETKLTLELMDDVGIPDLQELAGRPERSGQPALIERVAPPSAPQQVIYQTFQQAPAPQVVYRQTPPEIVYVQQPPRVVYRYAPPPPPPAYYPSPYPYPSPYAYRYGPGY